MVEVHKSIWVLLKVYPKQKDTFQSVGTDLTPLNQLNINTMSIREKLLTISIIFAVNALTIWTLRFWIPEIPFLLPLGLNITQFGFMYAASLYNDN